jgi:hypothetical protein
MSTHDRAVAAPHRPLPDPPLQPPEPGAALLESLGAIEDEDNILVRMLSLHGFTVIRVNPTAGRQVVSAEAPAFGLRRCN